jgi:transposase
VTIEQSHPSQCSFLDLEPILEPSEHHDHYLGKRGKRGLFVARTGHAIPADVNASYNILQHPTAVGAARHCAGRQRIPAASRFRATA